MFENLNKRRTVADGIETSELDFIKLADCVGRKLTTAGYFFTDGRYGKQVVVVATDGTVFDNGKKAYFLVNMPARAVEQFEQIDESPEMKNAVINGKLSIIDIKPVVAKNGNTVSYFLKG